jgi:hypothetical protein
MMFEEQDRISRRHEPFHCYTTRDLWTDEHISAQMPAYHLDPDVDVSSGIAGFIHRSA